MITEGYLDRAMINLQAFILFVVFMVLKLTEIIDWSWWYVFMPVLLPLVIFLMLLVTKAAVDYWASN